MVEGGRNTGMCQQLQLPGAEIVKALQGKRANAQMTPRSFLRLLESALKIHRGCEIRSLLSIWPRGGAARQH